MATEKKETAAVESAEAMVATEKKETREEIFIPKDSGSGDPNLFVSVNGVNYVLPRGKTSLVPSCVAKEIRRSWKAQQRQDETIDSMVKTDVK